MPKDPAWTQVDPKADGDGTTVICKICKANISLGKDKKTISISAAKRHIKTHHFAVWSDLYCEATPTRGQKRHADETAEIENIW